MKYVYLIRHSSPFIEIDNYTDYENVLWDEYNNNMILSSKGEEKAKELCKIEELKNIDNIYSSNSPRALSTAKYLSENNNVKIKLDNRIDERDFGIKYLSELPSDFTERSFIDRNFKMINGESLNDITKRLNNFICDELSKNNNTIIVTHGIILLSFLQSVCEFTYKHDYIIAKYKSKTIIDGKIKSPGVYKITYDDSNTIVDISVIN